MRRRTYLRLAGIASLGGVAGCSGLNSSEPGTATQTTTRATPSVTTTSGPAKFKNVQISLSEEPTVGTVPVTIAATNVGGEAGSLTDTLEVEGPRSLTSSVEIADVDPGYRGQVTIDLTLNSAGVYEFTLADRDVKVSRLLNAKTAQIGETLTLERGVEITLEDVIFHAPVTRLSEDKEVGIGLPAFGTGEEAILTAFDVSIENTGDSLFEALPGTFELPLLSRYSYLYFKREDRDQPTWMSDNLAEKFFDSQRVLGQSIRPGSSKRGVVLGQVDYDEVQEPIPFAAQSDFEKGAELKWTAPPPSGGRSLPRFEIRDVSFPSELPIDSEQQYEITVANVGQKQAEFRGLLQYIKVDNNSRTFTEFQRDIAPGKTTTFSGTVDFPYVRDYDVRLFPYGDIASVTANPIQLPVGATYTTEQGVELKMILPIKTHRIAFGRDRDTVSTGVTPEHAFLTIGVQARILEGAEDGAAESIPGFREFVIPEPGGSFGKDYRIWNEKNGFSNFLRKVEEHGNKVQRPHEGPLWPENPADHVEDGLLRGFLPMYMSNELSVEEAEVQYRREENEGQVVAIGWSKGHQPRN